jgi:ketosteroid isomerase-like protein
MMTHPNAELARSEMKAVLAGDLEGMLEHYAEDVVFHYPGRNPLSGTYHGKDGVRSWAAKADELLGDGGSLTRTLHDIVANDDYAIQLVSVDARRADGRTARWDAAAVMRVHNGKFSDIRIDVFDPYAVDELFA